MPRITNFGRKRTYLEAGFHNQPDLAQTPSDPTPDDGWKGTDPLDLETSATTIGKDSDNAERTSGSPPKKRRKRGPQSKKTVEPDAEILADDVVDTQKRYSSATTSGKSDRQRRQDTKQKKAVTASEARRLKRLNQKLSETTCFACREKGHAAKDCPKATMEDQDRAQTKSKFSIGICYRCGSKTHTLSRCKKPSKPDDPFPFASCFVCNGKGHLASGCPQNNGRGIYPTGGCCKLCGETTHLARNCTMRQKANDPTVVIGTAREAGADEDDFHIFRRELDRTEKREEKVKKMWEIKKGVVSGVVAANNAPIAKKKVVVFK